MTQHLSYYRSVVLLLNLLLFLGEAKAQSPNLAWAKRIGGTGNDIANSITKDNNGNIYMLGAFRYTADFDPGPLITDTFFLTTETTSYADLFITKISSSGKLIWAKQIASKTQEGSCYGKSLSLDNKGNLYFTGRINGTVDFNTSQGLNDTFLLSSENGNIFVAKLNNDGEFVWAKQFGGTQLQNDGISLALDEKGNIYSTGTFNDTVDFDPGPGIFTMVSTATTGFFTNDMYISKLDSNGNFLWAKQIASNSKVSPTKLVLDHLGNIFTTGYFLDTTDFNPGIGVSQMIATPGGFLQGDIFISKLDTSGSFIWAKQIGGDGSDAGRSLFTDKVTGALWVTGFFSSTCDFNPDTANSAIYNLTSLGGIDIFVLKMDKFGNFMWARQMGGDKDDAANSLALDESNNVYTTGSFEMTADFDPGINNFPLTSSGLKDIFISKLDSSGNFVWAKKMGGKLIDEGIDLQLNQAKDIYTAGIFSETANFDFPNNFNLNAIQDVVFSNPSDVFLHKLSLCASPASSIDITCCNEYTFNNQTYNATGFYNQSFLNAEGCDSIATFNLTVNKSTVGYLTQKACSSFTLGDTTFTRSGTFTPVFPNSVGCDSVVTLILTILDIDTALLQNNNTFTARATGARYQWIDCNNNNAPISGAEFQIFTASTKGNYAVIITQNDCVDTSVCYSYESTGITGPYTLTGISLFPNPTKQRLNITTDKVISNGKVRLLNSVGQVLFEKINLNGNIFSVDISPFSPGIYMLQIIEERNMSISKIIKN